MAERGEITKGIDVHSGMQEAVSKNAEVERETGKMAAEKSNNKTKRREGEGEKAAKDTEAGEDIGAASLERGQAGVKTGVTAAKMAEVPRGGGGVEGAEENGPNDGVTGGNGRRTSEDGNRSEKRREKEGVSNEEEEENAEPGVNTDSRPGKSRRSPLQTLYNGDQLELLAAQRSLQGRRELLEQACLSHTRKRQVLSPEDLKHLIVDDKHSLIYCYVPKVACTNWKRVLMVLTSDGRYTDPLSIPANEAHVAGNLRTLSEFSVPEINRRLRSYLKFIFVRDPFERLVSAYRNKFTRSYNTAFHRRYGTKIIRRHRPEPDPEEIEKGNNVLFHEFVQYLVDPRTQREEPFNEHWERVHSLCHPCLIHYDVVGKYETLEPDAQAVLSLAGVEGTLQFPTSGKSTRTDGNMAARYFKHISPFYQKKLFNLYRMDFLLFNYSTPEYLRT
ncbi:carbohydrate sulfotransferase 11-like isoform X2 [Pseudochaenichthys georgianus]|uniref:carbohydrate sulfotransferase 11-like isoform X2 n=1 Tax=Pseudochaenichthys georgianus TaxID=52239 RepID=UPI00146F5BDB|nr:carbohydrate sulfotransferase 11 isoform X2 [Pseudochaenichthys georgianus]